jgi:hypothetical protein
MSAKRITPLVLMVIVLFLAQLACSAAGFSISRDQSSTSTPEAAVPVNPPVEGAVTQASGNTGEPSTPLPVQSGPPTPTPYVYQGPKPNAGLGGVYGRLRWNGQPVEGVQVKLCDEIKFIGGCQGAEYPTVTDANGAYIILNVPPGDYGLTYRALEADTWYFVTSGFLNTKNFEVKANQMVDVGDHHTVRLDVVILTPAEDERLTVARPVISWEPYPSAAYYALNLHSDRGGVLVSSMKLTDTSFALNRDLQSCGYSFNVEVYNSQGIMIAENDGWHSFAVGGFPQNCKLVALTPADGATVSANNITLT